MDQYEQIAYSLFTLAVPFAIRYGIDRLRKKKEAPPAKLNRPPRASNRLDTFSNLWLLTFGILSLYHAFTTPYSFLKTIGASVDSPSFVVRNAFRDYMTATYKGYTPPDDSSFKDASDPAFYKSTIIPLEKLYEKLRAAKWRKLYGRFGHDALTNCNWCSEEMDYAIYDICKVFVTYALALLVLGIGTTQWRKSNWRNYGIFILMIPITVDMYCFVLSSIEGLSTLEKEHLYVLYELTHRIRHIFIAALFLMASFWNQKDIYTDQEAFQDLLRKIGYNYSRTISLRLAKAAVFGQTNLRQRFMDYNKQREAEKDVMVKDLEFQELRRQVLAKHSLAEMIESANRFSNDVMQIASFDGLLTEYDQLEPSSESSFIQ